MANNSKFSAIGGGVVNFGFLNVYKPRGMTSHDVVGVMRKLTGIRQIGHTGTLDPFAEGVLPICIGKATRLIEYLSDDKEYLATIKFGADTSTYDLEGDVVEQFDTVVKKDEVIKALKTFEGKISQMPPMYSAIKVNGKKLYEYARNGETVDVKPRDVIIYKIELKNFYESEQIAEVLVKCSKGTYIRSIAYDLGKKMSTGAHLINLVRTQAGCFRIDESVKLDSLKENPELISNNMINPINVIELPKVELSVCDYEKVLHGMAIENKTNYSGFVILIYNMNISAIGFICDKKILVKKVFS